MYIYIYMYVRVCICIYIYMFACVYICICIDTYNIYTYIYTHIFEGPGRFWKLGVRESLKLKLTCPTIMCYPTTPGLDFG